MFYVVAGSVFGGALVVWHLLTRKGRGGGEWPGDDMIVDSKEVV